MAKAETFHVVRQFHNGEFRTYSIYADNEPYLIPGPGIKIGKREAYAIAKLLNHGPWM